jgi:hypothetical protein
MGIASITDNSSFANGLMSCPKCGHKQESRLDCRRCGVVFSKYYTLFPSIKSADASPLAEQDGGWSGDIQIQLHELSARITEIEFEKAERNRLRTDLRSLEEQFQKNMEQTTGRLQQCESRCSEVFVPSSPPDFHASFPEINERFERIEDLLINLDDMSRQVLDLREKAEKNSKQILDLRTRHSAIGEEITSIKSQLDIILQAQKDQEPRTPIEQDLHAIRMHLEDFRQILSKPV